MDTSVQRNTLFHQAALAAITLAVVIPFAIIFTKVVPVSMDWLPIRTGVRSILSGQGYVDGFFNPPWTAVILAPLALLPASAGGSIVAFLSLFVMGYTAHRMGARLLHILLLLTSAPVIGETGMGNVDWLVALGLLFPPQIGLFLVLIKPQVGIGIALFWLWQAWQSGGWKEILRTFAPVTGAFILSFAIYGFYLVRPSLCSGICNTSLFPYAVIPGLALLFYSIRRRQLSLSAGVGVLIAPYISFPSYSLLLLSFVKHTPLLIIIYILLWVYALAIR